MNQTPYRQQQLMVLLESEVLFDSMEERSQRNADECLDRAVNATGSPLMLTGNVYWKRFLNILRPAYTPPTRHALSTNLSNAELNRVQMKVKQIIEKADCKHL